MKKTQAKMGCVFFVIKDCEKQKNIVQYKQ